MLNKKKKVKNRILVKKQMEMIRMIKINKIRLGNNFKLFLKIIM